MRASACRFSLAALAFLAAAAPAPAQSSPDSLGWHLTAAAGYVQTSGNSRLSSVNVGDKLLLRASHQWAFTQTASWVYGKNAGVESANRILAGLRADYSFSPRVSLYALGAYERNRFAGITTSRCRGSRRPTRRSPPASS